MKDSVIEIMEEATSETIPMLKELLEENIKPLIRYRAELEKKIATKEINEMYEMEEGL